MPGSGVSGSETAGQASCVSAELRANCILPDASEVRCDRQARAPSPGSATSTAPSRAVEARACSGLTVTLSARRPGKRSIAVKADTSSASASPSSKPVTPENSCSRPASRPASGRERRCSACTCEACVVGAALDRACTPNKMGLVHKPDAAQPQALTCGATSCRHCLQTWRSVPSSLVRPPSGRSSRKSSKAVGSPCVAQQEGAARQEGALRVCIVLHASKAYSVV